MNNERISAILTLANFPVTGRWEMMNQYWPRCADYAKAVIETPWWLVRTPWGMVVIGWRKRVINIDWTDTPLRVIITEDGTTKDTERVHAWSEEKAIEYLKALRAALMATPVPQPPVMDGLPAPVCSTGR